MKTSHPFAKAAALASSTILAGVFIAYAAGAYLKIDQTNVPIVDDEPGNRMSDVEFNKAMMSGTKSFGPEVVREWERRAKAESD